MQTVFMFSGQGSHYYQMGRELYDNHPRFRLWMNQCNDIVSPLINSTLLDEIYTKYEKSETFDTITLTNPALLAIEFSLAKILMEKGIKPDVVLGYSLGEITAAVVSQAVTLEEGLMLAVELGKILKESSPKGAMLAIINNESIMDDTELFDGCYISGRNFDRNFVVSGLEVDILKLQTALKQRDILTQRLAVNYAFHSPIMETQKQQIKTIVSAINYRNPNCKFVSSNSTNIAKFINGEHLWKVLREPVDFAETIRKLLIDDSFFIDVGPSGSLAATVKQLLPQDSRSKTAEVMNQFGKDLRTLGKFEESLPEPLMV